MRATAQRDLSSKRLEGAGAGDGIRTRDINLGKVALYQLSYSRLPPCIVALRSLPCQFDDTSSSGIVASRLRFVYDFR